MRRKPLVLLLPSVLLAVGVAGTWRVYPGLHQQWLNNQLFAAVRRDDIRAVVSFLDQGANPNAPIPTDPLPFWRILKYRLQGGQPEISRTTLLEAAFHVKVALAYPAFEAEDTPDIAILTLLLEHGASLHPKANNGIKIGTGHLTNARRSPCVHVLWGANNPDGTGEIIVGTEPQTEALVNAALKAGARRF